MGIGLRSTEADARRTIMDGVTSGSRALARYWDTAKGYARDQFSTAMNRAGGAGQYMLRQRDAASRYLQQDVVDRAAVEADVIKRGYNPRTRLAIGLTGLMAVPLIYFTQPTFAQTDATTPPAPPAAGQTGGDEQTPGIPVTTVQPTPQEETSIFPCAKSGETWDAQNPKFKELFLGPRRQRVLKFSSHAEPYVKAVESGETTATCRGYDISFLRRGQRPFPLRAIGPDGELLMNVIGNRYDSDAPPSLNTDFVITVKGIKGLEQINLPISETRPNLSLDKYDPPAQGRWNVTIGGRRYDITEFGIGVWLDPKTSKNFDFVILYFKSGMVSPVQGFKGYTPAGKNFKNLDKSRIFGDTIWEVIDKMNKGNYYGRHSDEFKH